LEEDQSLVKDAGSQLLGTDAKVTNLMGTFEPLSHISFYL
jgi:hypothetical protein